MHKKLLCTTESAVKVGILTDMLGQLLLVIKYSSRPGDVRHRNGKTNKL